MPFSRSAFSGFPFDNSGRRTRDPLEDIAQRHPEFAQHLQGFPRRSQRAGGDQDQDEFLRRRFERPFASGRFERFGFPFDRDDFEREPQRYYEAYPEYFENFQNQQTPPPNSSQQQTPPGFQQYPPQYSQEYQPQKSPSHQQQQSPPQYQTQASQCVSQGTQTEEEKAGEVSPVEPQTDVGTQEQKNEGGQTRGRPIQQSNTCDLAQYQPQDEALNEREQRSMSAPPENKRFTSSVNIPMGGVQQDNNGAPSGAGVKSQASTGSTERVIPIHVEGRDVPVMPKHFSGPPPSTHQQQQPQPERIFSESPRPQPETIFGRRPEHFTQFVNRDPHRFPNDWPHSFGGFPEEEFGFRQESPNRFAGGRPQQQHQHQQQHYPQQQHQQQPQQQQHHKQEAASQAQPPQKPHQEAEPPKPQQPPKQPLGPIEQIQAIQKDVSALLRQVEAFNGVPKDKNYLYIDEMLTRNLLKLDNVDTQGQDTIRSARKEAIKCIEKAISLLESKAAANVAPKEEKMEVEEAGKQSEEAVLQEAMEMSPAASQSENMELSSGAAPVEEGSNKSAEGTEEPKSGETLESSQEQAEKKEEGLKEATDESGEQAAENKEENAATKTETKEGEKKEKKKTKKKVNKEDKDKKQ